MKVVVTGGTGFVGRKLVAALLARGDEVTVLSRRASDPRVPSAAKIVRWTPTEDGAWSAAVDGVDAVVHLAGEPVIGRWSAEQKARIRESRVVSTERLVAAIARAKAKPRVLVCASAIGYYGDHAAAVRVDETSPPGSDFLAEVVTAWEHAAERATDEGTRVVRLRIGIVLGEGGGALAEMLGPFRWFVGGPIGSGTQMFSWIHADDVVGLVVRALDDDRVVGAINATAPTPVDMNELAKTLGRVLHRPSFFRVPTFAIKAAFGEGSAPLLGGARVLPTRALELGYAFRWPILDAALTDIVR